MWSPATLSAVRMREHSSHTPVEAAPNSSYLPYVSQGAGRLSAPLHLEVSQASARARAAVEAAGGSVRTVYYNKLGVPLQKHGFHAGPQMSQSAVLARLRYVQQRNNYAAWLCPSAGMVPCELYGAERCCAKSKQLPALTFCSLVLPRFEPCESPAQACRRC